MSSDLLPESTLPLAVGGSDTPGAVDDVLETSSSDTSNLVIETPSPDTSNPAIETSETPLPTPTPTSTPEPVPSDADPDTERIPALSEAGLLTENREISIDSASESAEVQEAPASFVPESTTVTEPIPVQNITAEKPAPVKNKGFTRSQKIIALSLVLLLLAILIIPAVMLINTGLSAYNTYKRIHDSAYSGYHHFLSLKPLVATIKAHPTSAISSSNLDEVQKELLAARGDFTQVQNLLRDTPVIQTIKTYFPQYRTQITSVQSASRIGIDVADIGLQLTTLGKSFGSRLQGSLLSTSGTPLITESDLTQIQSVLNTVKPLLDDIQSQSQSVSLNALPLSQSQRLQVVDYLSLLPQAQSLLTQSDTLLGAVGWLLGVDSSRSFLVQPMDRAELRATGGFTGQYGELTLKQGRVEPFSMRNIALLEYIQNSDTMGQEAPAAYRSWWPFANWGLRDSNLSADFPTSAKLAIKLYKQETGRNVDGVIMMTPFAIEDVLKIIGPVYVPQYHETITAQNLEDRLHYYQLGKGIAIQKVITHLTNDDAARKQFTSQLAHVIMDTVRHAPPDMLLKIGKQLLFDLKSRDLQVYVQNAQIENLLTQYGYAGTLDRSTGHDGLYIVQANVSASKASQYVRTLVNDQVTLDQQGGATHHLKMQLIYNQQGPVYGLDTYRDYVRFYVPSGAVLRDGDGFDSGQALCGGVLGLCPETNVYPQNELVCPSGQYDAGYAAPMLNDPYTEQDHPLDSLGKPTNLQSDEPGRAMFAGYVVIPKNCAATVTLSWYVPPASLGNLQDYRLLIQRQAGTYPEYQVTINPPMFVHCHLAPSTKKQTLQEDLSLSLRALMNGSIATRICAASLLS
jgi:Protein of unknown function (DUF4012)